MSIDIEQILTEERLVVYFQPIVSANGRTLFGFESLIRGLDKDGNLIPPYILFEAAKQKELTLELDKLARTLAIKAFEPLFRQNNKLILFVNFESKLIDVFEPGSYLFYGELQRLGIPYENVVLEVKEDAIADTLKLKTFCEHYRNLGFNIALDDFGVGQSSFDRIAVVRPDIIKIDRSLISDIQTNKIHQEIVSAICKMCHNIGALALAEGVESIDETVCSFRLGAKLMQGFYFAKPSASPLDEDIKSKITDVNTAYANALKNMQKEEKKFHDTAKTVEDAFCVSVCEAMNIKNWNNCAKKLLDEYENIEALYLIDNFSKQVGPTLMRTKTRSFYEPTEDGHDYSLKEYHIRVKDAINGKHLTEPYLSLASGSLCRTYAARINLHNDAYILCIDFLVSKDQASQ